MSKRIWTDKWAPYCTNLVALSLSANLPNEFTEPKLVERWKAESIGAFIVESDLFITGKFGETVLPSAHLSLLQSLWSSDSLRLVLRAVNDVFKYNKAVKFEWSQALRHAVRDVLFKIQKCSGESSTDSAHYLNVIEYKDVLQAPLQPLSENLDSGVYNTFEQDQTKYVVYGEAVEGALKDLGADGRKSVVVYLLGGGRGPIVSYWKKPKTEL
uniref:PRMT5 arginine-N-methyltransferase domain-containing protein n=1 Tax=Caenorhabditis japonica TaxID=281687 RepID=A0A8R1EMH1_CAEJA